MFNTDHLLVQHIKNGNEQDAHKLYVKYYNFLYKFFKSKVKNIFDVDDLVALTLIEIFEKLAQYQPLKPFKNFVFIVAFNNLKNYRKSHNFEKEHFVSLNQIVNVNDSDEPLELIDFIADFEPLNIPIRFILQKIFYSIKSVKQQKTLEFVFFEKFSVNKITKILSLPNRNATYALLHRAVNSFKILVEKNQEIKEILQLWYQRPKNLNQVKSVKYYSSLPEIKNNYINAQQI